MLAAAAGVASNSRTGRASPRPNSSASTRGPSRGIAGAASWSRVNASPYGPASCSGSAASIADIHWPTFMAPPLSSPKHGEQLLRGACLHFRRDQLGRSPADTSSETHGSAARERRGERGKPRPAQPAPAWVGHAHASS